MAPRQLFEVKGRDDGCSDMTLSRDEKMRERRQAHAGAREVYRALGGEGRLESFEFEGGHSFPEDARKASYAWPKLM